MSKWLAQFGDMTWSMAVLFALVACAIYWFGIRDDGSQIDAEIEAARNTFNAAQESLNKMKRDLENATKFEAKVKATKEDFEKVISFMPEDMNAAKLNEIVSEQVGLSGLRSVRIEPQADSVKRDFYETSRLSFEVEGTFAQVMTLLSNISRIPRLMTFDSIQIDTGRSGSGATDKLSFKAVIVGYRYVPDPALNEDSPATKGAANAP